METSQYSGGIFSSCPQMLGCRPGGVGGELDLPGLWSARQAQEIFSRQKTYRGTEGEGSWVNVKE